MPTNLRVAGAKAVPGGSLPPAQAKEYAYGSTPPEASGSVAEWYLPMTRSWPETSGSARGAGDPTTRRSPKDFVCCHGVMDAGGASGAPESVTT